MSVVINSLDILAAETLVAMKGKKRKFEVDKENIPVVKKHKIFIPSKEPVKIPKMTKGPEDLLARLKTSKSALKLWEDAKKIAPNLRLQFASKELLERGGGYNRLEEVILIQEDLGEDEKLATLLFELCNVVHSLEFAEVDALVHAGKINSPEKFAFAVEVVEYRSVCQYSGVMRSCVEQDGWSASLYSRVANTHTYPDFQTYWSAQASSGHAKLYMDEYTQTMQELQKKPLEEGLYRKFEKSILS